MRRSLFALPVLALALIGVLGFGNDQTAGAQAGGVIVDMGRGEPGYSVNQFLPREVTVAAGTTITWRSPWPELHILAALEEGTAPPAQPEITENAVFPNENGYVFSGEIFGNPENPPLFDVTFPEAGTYQYFCPVHPQMTGTVTVVASGNTDTQAEIDARADAEYATNIALVKALAQSQAAKGGKITPRADGTNLFEVIVGGVDANGNDAQLFFPAAANVKTGDTIKWVADAFTPHTVTFNAPPGPPQGDPFAIPQSPGTFAGGNMFVHSGILTTVPGEFGANDVTSYELTFTAAGSYTYVCILHAPQGMVGTVNVAQATTPTATATATPTQTTAPRPPSTGTGTEDGMSTALLLVVGAAVAFLAAGGAFAAATLRNR